MSSGGARKLKSVGQGYWDGDVYCQAAGRRETRRSSHGRACGRIWNPPARVEVHPANIDRAAGSTAASVDEILLAQAGSPDAER